MDERNRIMNIIPKEVIDMTKLDFKKIAEELISVQPMSGNLMSNLMNSALSEKELIEQGYKPVSRLNLMWMKENDERKD